MTKYEAAIQAHKDASVEFSKATQAYRARTINDDTYLVARALYQTANAEFDLAFQAAQDEADALAAQPAAPEPDHQVKLF